MDIHNFDSGFTCLIYLGQPNITNITSICVTLIIQGDTQIPNIAVVDTLMKKLFWFMFFAKVCFDETLATVVVDILALPILSDPTHVRYLLLICVTQSGQGQYSLLSLMGSY
jgi:hypothetical protein